MPYCPKCLKKLTKRKKEMTYVCQRHGFVRHIYTPNTPKDGSNQTRKEIKNDFYHKKTPK